MSILLDLDPQTEARVRQLAAAGDYAAAKRELDAPLEAAVRRIAGSDRKHDTPASPRFEPSDPPRTPAEVELLLKELDDLAEETAAELGAAYRPLSPEALTREAIYGDHP